MKNDFRIRNSGRAVGMQRGSASLAAVGLALLLSSHAGAQTPKAPVYQTFMNAGASFAEAGADFGRILAMGKVGPLSDLTADVVYCAVDRSIGGVPGVGEGYAFDGATLAIMVAPIQPPSDQYGFEDSKLGLGALDIAIGNVLGAGVPNLVFIAAAHDDRSTVKKAGAVDIYDMNSATPTVAILALLPPLDLPPIQDNCTPETPAGLFGHSLALADIDDDGYNDLVVGAATSTEDAGAGDCSRIVQGRVYVFGHPNFFAAHYPDAWSPPGYLYRCIAIRAPQAAPGVPRFVSNGTFGLSVDAADLDNDGKAEILVGRAERELDRGRAHLFLGSWIVSQLPAVYPSGVAYVITPPAAHDKNLGEPNAYETLVDTTDSATARTTFGFNVFMLGKDVGTAQATGFDGKPDIAINSDKANFLGSPAVPSAGALFVFLNNSNGSGTGSLVDEAHGVKLQTPSNVGSPIEAGRFGFVTAAINWATTTGGSSTATFLLVGEPGATVSGATTAGRVYMLSLPIDASDAAGALGSSHTLTDPTGVEAGARFGNWLAVGDYAVDPAYPGDEFVVSARGRTVFGKSGAGQAYSYRSAP